MMRLVLRLLRDESGGPLVEYGLVVSLVAIAAIGALVAIGTSSNTALTTTQSGLVSSAETYPVINP
jgi:Flp pilus assembly pilin Flp